MVVQWVGRGRDTVNEFLKKRGLDVSKARRMVRVCTEREFETVLEE